MTDIVERLRGITMQERARNIAGLNREQRAFAPQFYRSEEA